MSSAQKKVKSTCKSIKKGFGRHSDLHWYCVRFMVFTVEFYVDVDFSLLTNFFSVFFDFLL